MGREKNDQTPLTYDDDSVEKKLRRACIEGDLDTVKECLADKADINNPNQQLNTSIHLASFYGKLDILQLLLQQDKAHINVTNQNGQTPLQLACIKGYIEIVQQLVNTKKCQLDAATDASNMTALHLASKHGHASVCQYLLDVGADRNAKDLIEKLPEYYAANEATEEVFRIRSKDGDVSINRNEEKPSSKQQAVDKSKEVDVKPEEPKKETKIEEKKIPEKQPEQKRTEEKQPEKKTDDIAQPNNTVGVEEKSEVNKSNKEAKQKESIEVKNEEIQKKNTIRSDQKNDKNPTNPKADNKSSKKESDDSVDRREPGGLRKERNRSKNITDPYSVEGVARLKIGAGQIRRGNFQKVKDHEFEWSDDFKKRQQLSVYDRLLGGAKKR